MRPNARIGGEIGGVKARAVLIDKESEWPRRKRTHADELRDSPTGRAAFPRLHIKREALALRLARVDRQVRIAEHEAAEDVGSAGNRLQLQRLGAIMHPTVL